jgi:hypothetical protein
MLYLLRVTLAMFLEEIMSLKKNYEKGIMKFISLKSHSGVFRMNLKTVFRALLAIGLLLPMAAFSEPEISGKVVDYVHGQTYLVNVGQEIRFDCPKKEADMRAEFANDEDFHSERFMNFVWVKALRPNANQVVTIFGKNGQIFSIKLKSTYGAEFIEKVMIREFPDDSFLLINPPKAKPLSDEQLNALFAQVKPIEDKEQQINTKAAALTGDLVITDNKLIQAEAVQTRSRGQADTVIDSQVISVEVSDALQESEPMKPQKNFRFETIVGMTGGISSGYQGAEYFGDIKALVAGKSSGGVQIQAAAMLDVTNLASQMGLSLGGGYEPDNVGIFAFLDTLYYLHADFDPSLHAQLRAAVRFNVKRVHFTGHYAMPFGTDQVVMELPDEPGYGWINKALSYAAGTLEVYLGRLQLKGNALFATKEPVYKLSGEVLYYLFNKVALNFKYQQYQNDHYFILGPEQFSSYSTFSLGAQFNPGISDPAQPHKTLYLEPMYPLVISKKGRIRPEEDAALLTAVLDASTRQGTAPLNVTLFTQITADPETPPYQLIWNVGGGEQIKSTLNGLSQADQAYTYYNPGTYQVHVDVTDNNGNQCRSNTIEIVVKAGEGKAYTIDASCSAGGTITPKGKITVYSGSFADFSFTPDYKYKVKQLLIDGKKSDYINTSYRFENVNRDHKIYVEFEKQAENLKEYTITIVQAANGTITPKDSPVKVTEGDSYTITATANTGYFLEKIIDNNQSVGAPSNGQYTLKDIKANHTLTASFIATPPSTYKVTAKVEGGQGSVSPAETEVTSGDSVTLTVSPNDGYEVESAKCNGQAVTCSSNKIEIKDIKENKEVIVKLKLKTYTVTASVKDNVGGSVSPASQTVSHGTNGTAITLTPAANYEADSATCNGQTVSIANNTIQVNNVTENLNIVVSFKKMVTIAISMTGSGKYRAEWGSNNVIYSSSQTITMAYHSSWALQLTLSPSTGYTLTSVKVDGQTVTANPFTVDRTKNHTVNITFSLIKYKVTTEIKTIGPAGEVGGSITPTGPKEYDSGSTTDKFTATANAGYKLMIFSDNGSAISGNTKQFTNIQADHKLYAEFRKELKVTPSTNDATVCPVWRSDNTNVSGGTVEIVAYGGNSLSYTPKFNAAYNNTHKFRSVVFKEKATYTYKEPTTDNFEGMTVNATVKAEATARVSCTIIFKFEDIATGKIVRTDNKGIILEGNPTGTVLQFPGTFDTSRDGKWNCTGGFDWKGSKPTFSYIPGTSIGTVTWGAGLTESTTVTIYVRAGNSN